jgi:signal peptidase I
VAAAAPSAPPARSHRGAIAFAAAAPLLVALAIRGFALEPFEVASDSMLPTLEAGDRLFVNKLAAPERGDVVVFSRAGERFVKRVVALPGERVAVHDGRVFVNGIAAEEWPTGTLRVDRAGRALAGLRERTGAVEHAVLDDPETHRSDSESIVPDGHYFVLGDNRDHSADSRNFGAIPREAIVGVVATLLGNGPRFEISGADEQ